MEPIQNIAGDIYAGPFHDAQRAAGATFYEDMGCLWTQGFGDPVEEYWAVRRDAGLWDVSSLVKFRFAGPDALLALERVTSRRVTDVAAGTVRYGVVLDEEGHMLDEATILVRSGREAYLFGNDEREPFVAHMDTVTHGLDVRIDNVTREIPNVAIQGPRSYQVLAELLEADVSGLRWFHLVPEPVEVAGVPVMLVRAGFTGELGYELYLLDEGRGAERVWNAVAEAGASPIGLDAIELLRVEAGLVIQDEDYDPGRTDPYELSMDAFIDLEGHEFVGREAAAITAAAPPRRFVTLSLEGNDAAQPGDDVRSAGRTVGDVRSAVVTPRFGALALAVVETPCATEGGTLDVGGRTAVVHGVPIDDPQKRRPRSDPLHPRTA